MEVPGEDDMGKSKVGRRSLMERKTRNIELQHHRILNRCEAEFHHVKCEHHELETAQCKAGDGEKMEACYDFWILDVQGLFWLPSIVELLPSSRSPCYASRFSH